ncbi:MAG: MFS transporter [Gemmataceae bacterium]
MTNPPAPTPPAPPSPWRWWVCALLLAATTINYLDRVCLNQTAADIMLTLRLTNTDYARLESGFMLAFAAGAILFGVIVDRVGVRWTYPAAVVGWSAFGFLTGFAPGYWTLLACRVGLGVFEAGNWPCGVRTIRQVVPPAERSLASAIFQSGTGLGAMLTPLIVLACVAAVDPVATAREAHMAAAGPAPVLASVPLAGWQYPFRVIGLIGLGWAVLWVLTVPGRVVDPANAVAPPAAEPGRFADVFRDRRFWLLALTVIGVNATWHTFRVWLPPFLEVQLKYTKAELRTFTFLYYAVADVGSWLVGLSVVVLTWAGAGLFRARLGVFAAGVGLVSLSWLVPFVSGPALTAVILLTGFGALGLFATYFALSQELSGRHQGKVTGALGAINSVFFYGLFLVQGKGADAAGSYEWLLAVASLPAVLALAAVYLFWPRPDRALLPLPASGRGLGGWVADPK